MRTKAKDLGTWLETYTVRQAVAQGLKAERLAEGGRGDLGDVRITLDTGEVWILECKNAENVNEQAVLAKAARKAEAHTSRVGVVRRRMKRKDGNVRRTQVGPITVTVDLELLLELLNERQIDAATDSDREGMAAA